MDVFSSLTNELRNRSARALVSSWAPKDESLRQYLLDRLSSRPGEVGSLMAHPVFEALFPWEQTDTTMADLAGGLLHPRLVKAMDSANEERFPMELSPYTHQLAAWQELLSDEPRSTVVTSGTGSGKTEAFMVPVMDHLVREAEKNGRLTGVQALFLYPLNALIANQRKRLNGWLEPLDGDARFCLYNGNTPETVPARKQRSSPQEVLSRNELREDPPPILVTNPTMLEYMLIRQEDQPILEASQDSLKFVILDEAHTYIGSQAAELSLLLRRVLHAFGNDADDVRFIATSATLGKEQPDAQEKLQKFLADLAGVPTDRVAVIEGGRQVPGLKECFEAEDRDLPKSSELESFDTSQRYRSLASSEAFREFRESMGEDVQTLGEASASLGVSESEALEILDLAKDAQLPDEDAEQDDAESKPLLPLRGHYFLRTQAGIWACVNSECSGKQEALGNWSFGQLFFARTEQCPDCKSKVFQVVLCNRCGEHYLEAEREVTTDGKSLLQPRDRDNYEQFQTLEDVELDNEEILEKEDEDDAGRGMLRLLAYADHSNVQLVNIDSETGKYLRDEEDGMVVPVVKPNERGRLRCNFCGESERKPGGMFRRIRSGSPTMLSVAIPTLLEHTPKETEGANFRPFEGRQAITFTDSRRSTANFAMRAQNESERTFTRGWLYEKLWRKAYQEGGATENELERRRKEISELESVIQGDQNHILYDELEKKRAELERLQGPAGASIGWEKAIREMSRTREVEGIRRHWSGQAIFTDASRRDVAELLLMREFLRRPMRSTSLETLGLVSVEYSWIDDLCDGSEVPADWTRRGLDRDGWVTFLKMCLDFFVRQTPAVKISNAASRWIGIPHRPKEVLRPTAPTPADEARRLYQRWPRADRSTRSRLVRLLGLILGGDLEDAQFRLEIDDILEEAWSFVTKTNIVRLGDGEGYHFDFSAEHGVRGSLVELATVSEAEACPVSRRILDKTLDGITPYATENMSREEAKCEPVSLPEPPREIVLEADSQKKKSLAREWLSKNSRVQDLRNKGLWSERSDRAVDGGWYFRIAEHSAQQPAWLLQKYEDMFRDKDLNILSCSTTMEMGVDIGGLTAVGMNNVPPAAANYRQRSGRAGRRGETAAMALTLCQSTPHGESVFNHPRWPFDSDVHVPRVSLESEPIIQRHLNALLLTRYLQQNEFEGLKLNTGWFFEPREGEDTSETSKFVDWLESEDRIEDEWLQSGLRRLQKRSALEGVSSERLCSKTAEKIKVVQERWRVEYRALADDFGEDLSRDSYDDLSPRQKAIWFQLKRLRGEYLLKHLASEGFLPGYGFPSGIVPFVNTNIEDIQADGRREWEDEEKGTSNVSRRRDYPSRPLPQAIREYAPGSEVTINNKVYKSRGLTLNWKIPANDKQVKEIQSIGVVWKCKECGTTEKSQRKPEECTQCGAEVVENYTRILEPAGFAVDIRDEPSNNLKYNGYVSKEPPFLSAAGAEWTSLVTKSVGRHRSTRRGPINHINSGEHGNGYAVCLQCGYAESEREKPASEELPGSMESHRPLRGGNANIGEEGLCMGLQRRDYSIQRNLSFGGQQYTDIYQLQLFHPSKGRPLNKTEATTLAVALRNSLCLELGIETQEIGYRADSVKFPSDQKGFAIYLYDEAAGGAGYAIQARELLETLLEDVRERLECDNEDCGGACHACLLDYDTQFEIDHLDRHAAKEVVTSDLLKTLRLPDDYKFFGESSELVLRSVESSVEDVIEGAGVQAVRFYFAGEPSEWDWWSWPLQKKLPPNSMSGLESVQLVFERDTLEDAPVTLRRLLASLLESQTDTNVSFYEASTSDMRTVGGVKLAEAVEDSSIVQWAGTKNVQRELNVDWGSSSDDDYTIVRASSEGRELKEVGNKVAAGKLQGTQGNAEFIEVGKDFNGPISDIGRRFWRLIGESFDEYEKLIGQHDPVRRVTYQDRYLRSPLVVSALYHVLDQLLGRSPSDDAEIQIKTTSADGGRSRSRMEYHDWEEPQKQKQIIETVFGRMVREDVDVELRKRRELGHQRELNVEWETGTTMRLVLDQGFGFLRTQNGSEFPFNANVESQAEEITLLDTRVYNENKSSFIGIREPRELD